MTEKPPAGWYPDSTGTTRWWDGNQWTDHQPPPPPSSESTVEAPAPPEAPAQPQVRGDARAEAKAAKAYAKAQRPWYKKKRFIIPIALIVLIGIGAAVGGGTETGGPEVVGGDATSEGDASSGDDSNKAGSKSNPVTVGQTVELEGTRYTVEKARTAPTVGDEFFKERANGVYVIVELTIENKKDETKTFSEEAAKFISADGKKYATDDDGSIAADDPLILEDMQPDVPKTGKLVYDVPKGKAKGGLLEVSDLFGGGEAYIDLGL
jgi:hypothetical protein